MSVSIVGMHRAQIAFQISFQGFSYEYHVTLKSKDTFLDAIVSLEFGYENQSVLVSERTISQIIDMLQNMVQ